MSWQVYSVDRSGSWGRVGEFQLREQANAKAREIGGAFVVPSNAERLRMLSVKLKTDSLCFLFGVPLKTISDWMTNQQEMPEEALIRMGRIEATHHRWWEGIASEAP